MTKEKNNAKQAYNELMKYLNNSGLHETNNDLYEHLAYQLDILGKVIFEEEK